ncbi:putative Ras-related protein Rab-5A [Paratrimastix pyriformis]|uniref:Ras-related protein Rab-5A n=1 Tax=Paratrimastix pyriformis TaxID=342808 RepID=A0ABQ8UTA4_9EUKA|nr:putative Ras-related protein Rab-5A [Paratrimastix pyriformis]
MIKHKIVLLGDASVGKTSIILRYSKNIFVPFQESTIGAAFSQLNTPLSKGGTFRLDVWDTAGQERYASLAPMYYRDAQGAIIVYDVTSRDSFERAREWVRDVKANALPDLQIWLCANKTDLTTQRRITTDTGSLFAEETSCKYAETSAKSNVGINELFTSIADAISERCTPPPAPSTTGAAPPTINPDTRAPPRATCQC